MVCGVALDLVLIEVDESPAVDGVELRAFKAAHGGFGDAETMGYLLAR